MFIIGNLLQAIGTLLHAVIFILYLVLIFQAVISWVNPDPFNPIVRFLHSVTEPILSRVRARLPWLVTSGIDFSPLVVLFGLLFIDLFLVATLQDLGQRLR